MEAAISVQDVANIVTFVAPGYFLLQTYGIIYAKRERNFSRLIIECAVFSLPIVAVTNWFWQTVLDHKPAPLNAGYALTLLLFSVALGVLVSQLRVHWPVRQIGERLNLGMPDEDFIRAQFLRLRYKSDSVTVKLKSGVTFSGTPKRGSIYAKDAPERYYFTNLAWSRNGRWDNRPGGIIVALEDVEYIETPKLKGD